MTQALRALPADLFTKPSIMAKVSSFTDSPIVIVLILKAPKIRFVVFLTHLLVPRVFHASRPAEKQLIFKGLKLSQGDRHDGMEVAG
jgi:hypothetical protein